MVIDTIKESTDDIVNKIYYRNRTIVIFGKVHDNHNQMLPDIEVRGLLVIIHINPFELYKYMKGVKTKK